MPLRGIVVVGTSTLCMQTKIAIDLAQSDEEDEAKNLISSLRKFLEKRN